MLPDEKPHDLGKQRESCNEKMAYFRRVWIKELRHPGKKNQTKSATSIVARVRVNRKHGENPQSYAPDYGYSVHHFFFSERDLHTSPYNEFEYTRKVNPPPGRTDPCGLGKQKTNVGHFKILIQ